MVKSCRLRTVVRRINNSEGEVFFVAAFLLFFGTVLSYLPGIFSDFLVYDDPAYVINNPYVNTGFNVRNLFWAFAEMHSDVSYWHPITWISHQLDVQLFGLRPAAHHLTNVLIHAFNTVLLLYLFRTFAGNLALAAATATLFAVHPLRVEPVLWISERKELLCLCFSLLCCIFYCKYVCIRQVRWRVAALVAFVFAVMSKPMAVTIPFLLPLLEFWPLGRIETISGAARIVFRDNISFLCISAAVSACTILSQHELGAMARWEVLSLGDRIDNAIVAYAAYFLNTLFPQNLVFCNTWTAPWSEKIVIASMFFLCAVTVIVFRFRYRLPFLCFGWTWYLITLFPVAGVIQAGSQKLADRYTYLPHIGLIAGLVWAVGILLRRVRVRKTVSVTLTAAVCVALLSRTQLQVLLWKDGRILFAHSAANSHRNWLAFVGLGASHAFKGDFERAEKNYFEALLISPENPLAIAGLASVYMQFGYYEEAVGWFERAYRKTFRSREVLLGLARSHALSDCPNDPEAALHYAKLAFSDYQVFDPRAIATLAAAYASAGQFKQAQATALVAFQRVPRTLPTLRADILAQLHAYEKGEIYRRQKSKKLPRSLYEPPEKSL